MPLEGWSRPNASPRIPNQRAGLMGKCTAFVLLRWPEPATLHEHERSEWQTRKQRIDARLCSLQPPWKILRHHDNLDLSTLDRVAVEELPTANGPADYGLFVGEDSSHH